MEEPALGLVLKIVSHIGHPVMVAAFAFVIAATVFALLLRAKRPVLASIAAAGIIILGVAPYAASAHLQSRGIYHVQVVVVRPDQSLADIAQVKSSNGGELRGELKMVAGGWQLDIPPQSRPADGKVTLSASVKDEFLKGSSTLVLTQDYYPTATIQLVAETSAMLRGVVVDEDLSAIAGATVSIAGYPDVAVTDQKGNFVLPAHAGKGQMVEVHAQKGQLTGSLSAPAGKVAEVIISRE
ncbi:MAG: carboxypeptidase-like regulatory domain-containing protein [Terriglobales bacterium]